MSKALRLVKKGEKVTVLDRETPVASLIPFESGKPELKIRGPIQPLKMKTLFTGIKLSQEAGKILQEDRQGR